MNVKIKISSKEDEANLVQHDLSIIRADFPALLDHFINYGWREGGPDIFFFPVRPVPLCVAGTSPRRPFDLTNFHFQNPAAPPAFGKWRRFSSVRADLQGKKCSKTCWNSAILCIFCACVCLMHHVCQLTAHYLCMTSGRLQRSINVPIRQRFVIWAICLFPPFLFVLEQRI